MTGFAAADGEVDGVRWHWELRTLNGRGLDIRFRGPAGFDDVEAKAREAISAVLARGSVQATLQVKRAGTAALPRLNAAALDEILAIARRLQDEHGAAPATADGLLQVRGVLEIGDEEPEGEARERLVAAALAGLGEALDALTVERGREGRELARLLTGQLDRISAMRVEIAALPAREPAWQLDRLKRQIDRLVETRAELSGERLHQEAAILATKADIREELDRLEAHLVAARGHLDSGGPVGRRLDFLSQEFNREANTICSKSGDVETSRLGVDLKMAIDQFKEQVQNVE